MASVVVSLLHSLRFLVRSRASMHLEILALRHQLSVIGRSRRPHLRLTPADRMLWARLSRALAQLAVGSGDRQTGDRRCVAPARLSSLLDMEEPAAHRTTRRTA